jgi:hypothetical protein
MSDECPVEALRLAHEKLLLDIEEKRHEKALLSEVDSLIQSAEG